VSRLFIGQREQNLISDITKELFRDVVGQKVYYYAISETKTRNHEIYNESPDKVWDAPIELPALVGSPERTVKTDIFGPEHLAKIEIFLHYRDLVDIGVNVTIGDFVRWGDTMYEIANIANLRNIYGHAEQTDGLKLECVQARKGQIDPPQIGPSDVAFSDPDAVQKEFEQTRGNKEINGQPTGDKRDLQENGVLEKPVTGPNRIVEDGPKGSDFYGDKW
jgi:hypothetical protein